MQGGYSRTALGKGQLIMDLSTDNILLAFVSAVLFILGTIFGSFINCTAGRIVAGEDWIRGKSHCEHCNHELGVLDLVPVLSYVFLGGRCRYCHTRLPIRYLLSEILMGILFVWRFLRFGILDYMLARDLVFIAILFGLSLVDLDSYIIPDGFIIAGIVNWLLAVFFVSDRKDYLLRGLAGGLLIGGMVLCLSLVMDKILKKESLGGGDVKLLFMVCLYTGAFQGLFLLFLSCVTGLLFVILLKERKIAFGPSISIAAFVVLLYGQAFMNWYLGLF